MKCLQSYEAAEAGKDGNNNMTFVRQTLISSCVGKVLALINADLRLLSAVNRTAYLTPVLLGLHLLPVSFRNDLKILVRAFGLLPDKLHAACLVKATILPLELSGHLTREWHQNGLPHLI